MPAEHENPGPVTGFARAVSEIVDKVSLYQDALQPGAREVGKAGQTLMRAVNACLMPLEGLVWGFEQVRDFVQERVARKLEHVPVADIQSPKASIAVPAIAALRYTGAETELAELFANLLATSMVKGSAHQAHPGFVEVIKNLCSDEARILKQLHRSRYRLLDVWSVQPDGRRTLVAKRASMVAHDGHCEQPALVSTYIDNLCRLSLVEIGDDDTNCRHALPILERYAKVDPSLRRLLFDESDEHDIHTSLLFLSDFGELFVSACVIDQSAAREPS